jgi:hypothetical protein
MTNSKSLISLKIAEYCSECVIGRFRYGWFGTTQTVLTPLAFKEGYRLKDGIFGVYAAKQTIFEMI